MLYLPHDVNLMWLRNREKLSAQIFAGLAKASWLKKIDSEPYDVSTFRFCRSCEKRSAGWTILWVNQYQRKEREFCSCCGAVKDVKRDSNYNLLTVRHIGDWAKRSSHRCDEIERRSERHVHEKS